MPQPGPTVLADVTAVGVPTALPLRARLGPVLFAGLAGVALAGPLLVVPRATVMVLLASALVIAVITHPPFAAYLLLGTTPLIVGMDRGSILPVVRPSEALALLAASGLVMRRLLVGRHEPFRMHMSAVDLPLLLLATSNSLLPLLSMVLRQKPVTADDILYALVIWKYVMVFLVVRSSIRTEAEVQRCLWISMAAGGLVAVIAILQSLDLFGVPELLTRYYAPLGDERVLHINRGTSTLASSLATGDVMAFNLAVALGWLARRHERRSIVLAASALFALGGIASGQFSAIIGLVVVVAAIGVLTQRLTRTVLRLLPVGLLGLVLLQPVIERRLSGFSSPEGLPSSWVGRLNNLRTYFWPELFSDFNFILGVRPAARVPAPESWRTYVWIESGHTWLLWSGGILLFVAFFVFLARAMRSAARVARSRDDAVGVAALAAFAALAALAVLMTFDAHLILRGAGDLLFSLIALGLTATTVDDRNRSVRSRQAGSVASDAEERPSSALGRSARANEWSSGERHTL